MMRGRFLAAVLLAAIGSVVLFSLPRARPDLLTTRPTWHLLPLTDARTGETFTFRDFAGKTVYVTPMATWCGNCRAQLGVVREVRARVDPARVVFVALSVETSLPHAKLARYADAAGFDWVFAVTSLELYEELIATFGYSVGNPSVSPHFIIRPDGSTSALATGDFSVESLIESLSTRGGL
jgi:thiol-disulfide isomerase/thioredoxin